MSTHEPDGIAEVLDDALRLAIIAGARLAERRARERERMTREAESWSAQEARRLRGRLGAERAAARTELAAVTHDECWEQATAADIERAWAQARELGEDPPARAARQRIRTELLARYGLEVDELTLQATSAEQVRERRDLQLVAAIDPQAAYDSVERRERLAEHLAGRGIDKEAIDARLLGDVGEALPPEAAAIQPRRAPKARALRRRGGREHGRQDRGR